MHIHPFLTFESAKDAMEYYHDAFGAEIRFRQPLSREAAESLGLTTDHLADTTYYGELVLNGEIIACADAVLGTPSLSSLVSIMLDFEDDEGKAQEMFNRISQSDDSRVIFPFTGHATGGRLGQVVDKFGVNWVITAGVVMNNRSNDAE